MSNKQNRLPVLPALLITLVGVGLIVACILMAFFGTWEEILRWMHGCPN